MGFNCATLFVARFVEPWMQRASANAATPPRSATVTTLANKPLICRRFYQKRRNRVKCAPLMPPALTAYASKKQTKTQAMPAAENARIVHLQFQHAVNTLDLVGLGGIPSPSQSNGSMRR